MNQGTFWLNFVKNQTNFCSDFSTGDASERHFLIYPRKFSLRG